jgi:hypothetical protein
MDLKNRVCEVAGYINVARDKMEFRAVVNTIMNLLVTNDREFIKSKATISFLRTSLHLQLGDE